MEFRFPRRESSHKPQATAEDYDDVPAIYNLLKQLPEELVALHAPKLDNLDDGEAVDYLKQLLEKRANFSTSDVSDPTLKRYFEGREKEIFSYIENDLSFGDRHLLGEGATAKVKAYYFETSEVAVPMAVKYVLTPIQGTVSAAEEYRILGEVEKIREIEKLESKDADKHVHVRVPHPYFQYESTKVQCYGMELVQGLTLHQVIEGDWIDEEQREKIKAALAGLSREQIQQEFEIFINNIHEYYLHNDIKPANIMISEEGIFYIIDFGQSEALVNMPGKTPEQIQSLKQDEVMKTKLAITRFFQAIR